MVSPRIVENPIRSSLWLSRGSRQQLRRAVLAGRGEWRVDKGGEPLQGIGFSTSF